MTVHPYVPVIEITRGELVESLHFGAAALVDPNGTLIASVGDPYGITYLRSTSKPLQVLPFVAAGGVEEFGLTEKEIAVMCASHSGTDEHAGAVRGIQEKIGLEVSQLLCGVHYPYHQPTSDAMKSRGEEPTALRHNCSGKHTGMLAMCKIMGWDFEDYINLQHPLQKKIAKTMSELCEVPLEEIHFGIDGCSVPVFGMPFYNAAWGLARLANPDKLNSKRAEALRKIYTAMVNHPFMISGPDRFDLALAEAGNGALASKAGAEAYHGAAIEPDGTHNGFGLAAKISDGDGKGRAKPAFVIEMLRQTGTLDKSMLKDLKKYGPTFPVYNWRKIEVGIGRPCFELKVY